MKLYVSHSSGFDYVNELYIPLRRTFADEHELILPHESSNTGFNTKEIIPTCDVLLAEVSYPSTGQGIEMGWADASNVPIVCLYRSGAKPSSAIKFISNHIFEYCSPGDMIEEIRTEIAN